MSSSPRGEKVPLDGAVAALAEASKSQLRQAIRAVYDLKEKRAEISNEEKRLKKLEEQIEAQIIALLQAAKIDQLAIDEADIERRLTVAVTPREYFSLSSKEKFLEFVFELQDPDMLSNVRPGVDSMRAYRDAQGGSLPPGVTQSTSMELSLRTTRKLKRDAHE